MDVTFDLDMDVFNYRVAAVMIDQGHVLIHKQARIPIGHCLVVE